MEIIKCTFVIIGSIIGAGFASGKEIYSFFYIYGDKGKIGIIISLILIGYIIFKSLIIIKKNNINNYDEFLKIIIKNKNKNIKYYFNFIINIFLLITFFVMCAGFSAYFNQEFKINSIFSGIFIAFFSYLILNKNIKGIFFINLILIPLILIILFIIGIKNYNISTNIINNTNNFNWIIKSILYASYNTVTLISILIPMRKYINNNKDIFKISFISTLIIFLMAQIIFILLLSINDNIKYLELPAVYATSKLGNIYKYLYGIIILGAIVTTEISAGYSFLNNISKNKYKLYNKIICILSIPISQIGFSNLVNNLYPIFGILGLAQIFLILKCK